MFVSGEIAEIREQVADARRSGRKIGCVPTMGALHSGHLSLIEACRKRAEFVSVTIFVNPTQFGAGEDLDKYPRPLEADLAACRKAGVAAVFTPEITDLYPSGFDTWVEVGAMSRILEGACRPGHFRGVTTIVCKLLNIVQPDVAYFGAKDYQQQAIIRQMVRDLDIPTEVCIAPTVREADGLAMSSRNQYLSTSERKTALRLSEALELAEQQLHQRVALRQIEEAMRKHLESGEDVRVEYAVIRDPDSLQELEHPQRDVVALVAAFVGQTRLIDNRRITLLDE